MKLWRFIDTRARSPITSGIVAAPDQPTTALLLGSLIGDDLMPALSLLRERKDRLGFGVIVQYAGEASVGDPCVISATRRGDGRVLQYVRL